MTFCPSLRNNDTRHEFARGQTKGQRVDLEARISALSEPWATAIRNNRRPGAQGDLEAFAYVIEAEAQEEAQERAAAQLTKDLISDLAKRG